MGIGRTTIIVLLRLFSGAGIMAFIILSRLFYELNKYEKALKESTNNEREGES